MPKTAAVAVLGDLHAGSTEALCPPSFRLVGGQRITISKQQKWLWNCWLDYCNWLTQFEIDAIVINGDLPNGVNARDVQNLSANEADQHNFVLAVLEPLLYLNGKKRTEQVYITRGTGFHSGAVGSREEIIARAIGAVADENGAYSRFVNKLTWRGKRLFFTHHVAHSVVYPLTPLQRAMTEQRLRAQVTGVPMPDVDIRSHVHVSNLWEAPDNKWIGTAPCWQGMTEYAHKVAPGSAPSIGGFAICLNAQDPSRIEVRRRLYPFPSQTYQTIPTTNTPPSSKPSKRTLTPAAHARTRTR